ncbi:MAG: uroporphyrinogen decarboxylase [Candidatus Melainabacteria bacterium]|nr:MAG: uroporphyrinogen decarboxylase [Candidatus Melainabacteria bacterium]
MPTEHNKSCSTVSASLQQTDPLFLRACRRQTVDRTPVWLMRQAGRFQSEYRAIREKVSFLELCGTPELAAQVTVFAVDQLKVDAAIIFADILLPLVPLGVGLKFERGDGPVIERPIACCADVDNLKEFDVLDELGYVMEAIRLVVKELKPDIPLIGFAGAAFTLASYMIEGGSSRNFEKTKTFMYTQETAWHKLMGVLATMTANYLNAQIAAGARAVQLFDSWVGCLSPDDYRRFVAPHMKATIGGITPGVPVIHFGTGTATLLDAMKDAGGDVIGLDWRCELGRTWEGLGDVAVQGNLDPVVLLAEPKQIRHHVERIVNEAAGRPGHIFNLGHGILPMTPVENVKYLVELVKELTSTPSE